MQAKRSLAGVKEKQAGILPELVMITGRYPYADYEPFVTNELALIWRQFTIIRVFAQTKNDSLCAEIPPNLVSSNLISTLGFRDYTQGVVLILFEKFFWKELKYCVLNIKHFRFMALKEVLVSALMARKTRKKMLKVLMEAQRTSVSPSRMIFYCYWTDHCTLAALMLKRNFPDSKLISRSHRWDVYDDLNKSKYLPYRKLFSEKLDAYAFISGDGLEYTRNKLGGRISSNMFVSRLGVSKAIDAFQDFYTDRFIIYSCSHVTEVKRIHLIVEALSYIDSIKVEWHHIGGGPLMEEIIALTNRKLGAKTNIKYKLLGQIDSKQIIPIVKENQYCFLINTSISEGIPVSMMEAMSMAIPVIGTKVGGVEEIVRSGDNGFLIDVSSSPQHLAACIANAAKVSEEDYKRLRRNAYNTWNKEYNADINYSSFLLKLKELNVL